MKKIYLTATLIACTITFSLGLTSCANTKQKSDIAKNQTSTIKKTIETSSSNSSPSSKNVTPTQPSDSSHSSKNVTLTQLSNSSSSSRNVTPTQSSNSSSQGNIKTIDYNQYIKKVLVVKGSANKAYNYSSFCISKIANGKIEGKFSTSAIAEPNYYYYLPDHLGYLGNLTGTVNNNTAECQFSDMDGDKGNVKLVFKTDGEIEATIKYTNKIDAYNNLSLDGTFQFIPSNLKDMDGFKPFKDQCFTVNLNSWGNVNFVSGKAIGGKHVPTLFYLTNKNGDILYNLGSPFPYLVTTKAVSFQDINNDGLKDIIIIVTDDYDNSSTIASVFYQKADGSFYNDAGLDQQINDSGNNKDIKAVTNYLSKKH